MTQYMGLLRIQNAKADWAVTTYLEREAKNTRNEKSQGNAQKTGKSGGTTSITYHEEGEDHSEGKQNSQSDGNDKDQNAMKQAPQSIAYQNGDFPEDMDWQYLTQQTENRTKTHTESKSDDNNDSTLTRDSTTGSSTTGNTTESSNDFHNLDENSNLKEITAGRSGELSEIFSRARDYIESSNAFRFFLLPKLERCFIMIYDI